MLSYANIATHKDNQPTALILTIGAKDYGWKSIFEVKKEKKKEKLNASFRVFLLEVQIVNIINKEEKKKRSTQSFLIRQETRSIKIFTSCCLMQL